MNITQEAIEKYSLDAHRKRKLLYVFAQKMLKSGIEEVCINNKHDYIGTTNDLNWLYFKGIDGCIYYAQLGYTMIKFSSVHNSRHSGTGASNGEEYTLDEINETVMKNVSTMDAYSWVRENVGYIKYSQTNSRLENCTKIEEIKDE